MIKNALNELGCEELPSGCDDLSVEQAFIDTNGNVDQTVREIQLIVEIQFDLFQENVVLVMGRLRLI